MIFDSNITRLYLREIVYQLEQNIIQTTWTPTISYRNKMTREKMENVMSSKQSMYK